MNIIKKWMSDHTLSCFFILTLAWTFIYVGIVMLLTYFIDGFIIKRDIEYINNHIEDRTKRG